jgi:hypothetical protein
MKLRKVTKSEPLERLSVSVHASTSEALKQYQAFYKSNTGDDIPMGLMVEEMLKTFMAKDRAFQKFSSSN